MVPVRSCTTVSLTPLGMARCSRGSSALMRCTVSMTLAPGWRMHVDDDGGRVLVPAADLGVLQAVDDLRRRP